MSLPRTTPLPAELPEQPVGFTRRMTMHLNFGEQGGAATFEVCDPDGQPMPFGYQYDTRRPHGQTGFTLPGREGVMRWDELRAYWPQYLASQVQAAP